MSEDAATAGPPTVASPDLTGDTDCGRADAEDPGRAAALAKIVDRLRQKSDFPTVTDTIRSINRTAASELAPASALCEVILDDVALTGKLLRVVNAACYGQFRGTIGTVSKAVIIVGFDAVRNIATSLLLFDHLQNKDHARQLRQEMAGAYFSALLADELLRRSGVHGREEIFISALFHRLGQLLVTCHMHEEHAGIERRRRGGEPDVAAARAVLGVGYEEIGLAIAKLWNFPEPLIASMRGVERTTLTHEQFKREPTRVIASLAHDMCDLLRPGQPERGAAIAELTRQCAKALDLEEDDLGLSINAAAQAFVRDAHLMDLAGEKKFVLDAVHRWNHPDAPEGMSGTGGANAAAAAIGRVHASDRDPRHPLQHMDRADQPSRPGHGGHDDPHAEQWQHRQLLRDGLAEVSNQAHERRADVLDMILETIHRGVGLQRVLLFVRDPQARTLVPRAGFGAGVQTLLRSDFTIPLDKAKSVFFAALDHGADLCIDDIDADQVRAYVPDWYRNRIRATGLLLLPVRIGQRPQALIYGDTPLGRHLALKGERLELVKALRDQAVAAFARRG